MSSAYFMLLRLLTFRHWRQSAGQSCLLVGILTLGVAVFVSIRLANRAAVASFANFTETLTGQSDWVIQSPSGSLPESVLPEIRSALGSRPVNIVPVLEVSASRAEASTEADRFGKPSYTLLGVDLLGLSNLKGQQDVSFFSSEPVPGAKPQSLNVWQILSGEPRVWVSRDFSNTTPDHVDLILNEKVQRVPIAGIIPSSPDAPRFPATLIILDLHQLQKLAGKVNQLDRVEFIIEAGPQADTRRNELRDVLQQLGKNGERWSVRAPGARREAAETMTRAFRLNLTVLSLIALLVGLYLIFQALDGAVVKRRAEIAVLRSLGVEENIIGKLWLLESAMLGLIGGALGVVLGWIGAQGAVRAVGQTVNALYYSTTVHSADLTGTEISVGLGVGVLASLIAGVWPAIEAARTSPAQILQRSSAPAAGNILLRSWPLGIALILAGAICTRLPPLRFQGGGGFPLAGYGTALCWIVGSGLLSSFLLPLLARLSERLGHRFSSARIAVSHTRLPSGRHRLATAALVCAIGMTSGMAILVASFDLTMRGWIQRTLQADLYVASAGAQSASSRNLIGPRAADAIASLPEIDRSSRLVSRAIEINGVETSLTGVDLSSPLTRPDTPWVDPPPDGAIYDSARNDDLALVSESFTERFHVHRGDTVRIPTPTGAHELKIAGVFSDYGNERGSILVERAHLREWYHETEVTNLALWLKPGTDADAVRAELLKQFPGLSVFTNAKLRAEVLRIFRQTFSITYALEVIGVIVAIVGLALTLVSVLWDRRDELTTLRALGFTRTEIATATSLEGLGISLSAVLGGIALSFGLGWLLIYVINKQSFGWTLGFSIPWTQLLGLGVAILITGTIVSYLVGRWGAALSADREE